MPLYRTVTETRVNAITAGTQTWPAMANLVYSSDYIMVWTGPDPVNANQTTIYFQRFHEDGQPVMEERTLPSESLAGSKGDAAVVATADGFAVSWTGSDANLTGVYMQRFYTDGTAMGPEVLVNQDTRGSQLRSDITVLSDGTLVVSWTSYVADGSGAGIAARLFSGADGTPIGDEFLVNSTTAHTQDFSDITALKDGGFIVTWFTSDGPSLDVAGQRFNADGTKAGEEIRIAGSATEEFYPDVAALPDGGYIVAWSAAGSMASWAQAQRFDAAGNAVGAPILMDYGQTSIAVLADGAFVITSSNYGSAHMQRFDAAGVQIGESWPMAAGEGQVSNNVRILALDDGSVVAGWSGYNEGTGDDIYQTRFREVEALTDDADRAMGTNDSEYMEGFAGNDDLYGGGGDDILEGGEGADRLYGGSGIDVASYVSATAAVTLNLATGVNSGEAAGDRFDGIEQYRLTRFGDRATGSAAADAVYGMGGNDLLIGGGGNDRLDGGDGDDMLEGGSGADALIGGAGDDEVSYLRESAGLTINLATGARGGTAAGDSFFSIERFTLSRFDDKFTGSAGADRVQADAGNDVLDGGLGDDQLDGGNGNDVLTGGQGADYLVGGAGNDSYVAVDAADTIVEVDGEGTDSLTVAFSYTLADGVSIETLSLVDAAATTAIDLTGNGFAQTISGNAGANLIDGGGGADTMAGGKGNDIYVVDDLGDKVTERDAEGSDIVNASVTFSLAGQYVEVLNLTGSEAINGTGNGLANRIVGNGAANVLSGGGGNDRLDGGAGADTMIGGLGNDVFVVDNKGDKVTEKDGEGTDTIESSMSYSLAGMYVEVLKLTGTANVNATGNSQVNALFGNAGANKLDGMGGADTMTGGAGNDLYVVDDAGDKVVEVANEGTDSVSASVTFSLAGQYAENLTLTGTSAINGTGNGLANVLTGNGAANTLNGGGGDDMLYGGLGADRLNGGAGADIFVFDTALDPANVDTILDFNAADDTVWLDQSVFGALSVGSLDASAFVAGTAALDADDRILFDQASGNLWYDADGNGDGAAVLFANFGPGEALSAADFVAIP